MKLTSVLIFLTAQALGSPYILQPDRYIDLHAHMACFGINSECFINEKLKNSFRFSGLQLLFGVRESQVKKNGGDAYIFQHISELSARSSRVKQVVLMAFDQVYSKEGTPLPEDSPFYVPNEFVAEGTRRFPNLLHAASVHPFRPDALEELERIERQGAMFVKLIPSIHKFHPNDVDIEPYWKKLAELRVPALVHLDDEGTFGDQSDEFTGVYKIERALQLGVTVIAAHVSTRGATYLPQDFCSRHNHHCKKKDNILPPRLDNYQQLRLLAMSYDNLYADISALPNKPHRNMQLLEIVKDKVWDGKLLYGSDYPLNHPLLQSKNSLKAAWDTWRSNGFEPEEFDAPHGPDKRWDRDIKFKMAFGIKEEVFLRTEKFLIEHGRLGGPQQH